MFYWFPCPWCRIQHLNNKHGSFHSISPQPHDVKILLAEHTCSELRILLLLSDSAAMFGFRSIHAPLPTSQARCAAGYMYHDMIMISFSTRISQGKPLSASNIQALDERFVGTKDFDGSNDMTLHNYTDGTGMYETILECPAPSFSLHDENSMPKPPAADVNLNPYETIPKPSGKNASLSHTDFNEEPPYQYTTPASQEASVNSLSQYQKLMVGVETPAYAALQKVQKLDISTTHRRVALGVDQTSCSQNGVEGNGTENSYATLLTVTKEDENEYSSLMIQP